MSESTSNKTGGRVFRIDRECYVIYVGSEDHRVRPFLRVGTSSNLPDRIRPFIGTVVLSDRVTGNPLQEAETVGAVGPRRPDYTGSPDLVHAFSPLTGMDRVRERPISSSERQLPQGAFVEFLTDGNFHLTVNSRRIYDLDEVEQGDRHGAYLLDRVAWAVRSSNGVYTSQAFEPPGFLIGTDRSVFRFAHGKLTATALQSGALEALARRLIDPDWLVTIAGPVDPTELLRWGKWRVRRTLLAGASQPVVVAQDASASEAPRRLDHLLEVLRVAGVPVERAPVNREFDLSGIPGEPEPTTLRVSGRGEWPTISEEILDGTPLVPGVPYRVFSGFDALPAGEAAGLDPGDADRSRDDAYGLLMTLLHRWNTETLDQEEAQPERFVRRAGELLAACPAPVWADLYPTGEGYSVRFMVQHGFSLKFVRENLAALERIDHAQENPDGDSDLFRGEQRRLLAFLDELLEQRRATTRAPAPAPAETPEKSAGTNSDAPKSATAETAPPAAASTADASAAASSPSTSTPEAPARQAGAAEHEGARGPDRRAVAAESDDRSRGKWRRPAFVVIGVVLIAGAVALLLWRDDTGERYLARLSAQGETAQEAGGEPGSANADDSGGDPGGADTGDTADTSGPAGTTDTADTSGAADTSDTADTSGAADTSDTVVDDGNSTNNQPAAGDSGSVDGSTDENGDNAVRAETVGADTSTTDTGATEQPIVVTIADIIRMVNRIAELNGYAPIGSMAPDARDPDWIFPGNELELPDGRLYEIRRGDTMWAIADRFIRQSAQEHNRALTDLTERIQQGERPTEELQVLLNEAYVETTRRRAGDLLTEIGVE